MLLVNFLFWGELGVLGDTWQYTILVPIPILSALHSEITPDVAKEPHGMLGI